MSSTETSSPGPRRSRPRSWLLLSAIVFASLLLTTIVFFAWLRSDSDLAGLRRELRAEHLPTSWEELDLHLSPPATLATWKRIGELSKLLKTYARQYPAFNGTTAALTPFSPVPDAARIQHAMLDQDRLDELRACVDALGDQRLEIRTAADFFTNLDEIGVDREVTDLLHEDALLADPARLAAACRRMLRFVMVMPRGTMLAHLVRLSQAEIALTTIAGRLDLLRRGPEKVDDLVEALSAMAVDDLPDMETREMLSAWSTYAKPLPADNAFSFTGVHWLDPLLAPVVLRAGRVGLLRHEAELSLRYARDLGTTAPAVLLAELERSSAVKHFTPSGYLLALFGNYDAMICRMSYECRLHGLLLLAELRGQAWPRDPFDPAHPQLRALNRAGRTVGAYHIGSDGVDHLGRKPDRYYPLLERLDPLKPPPP